MDNKRFYVTISRQFGSGGGEIASKVAAKLGVRCYDKSLPEMTSVVTGFDKNVVVSSEEQTANNFWYSGFLGGDALSLYDKIYMGQAKVIKSLAEKGSCVFVGRCASRILNEYDNVIRIFICAPMEIRKKRVSEGYNVSLTEAEKLIKKNDKARSAYYKKYGDADWGKAENYDLIVNTKMGVNKAATCIADLVKDIIKNK
ncbi:MAG: cytidylate kinase-like family protein [Clostridiales bacterium]|nr:cytidylate kinase-like family protein [Clostridiales bacterium]